MLMGRKTTRTTRSPRVLQPSMHSLYCKHISPVSACHLLPGRPRMLHRTAPGQTPGKDRAPQALAPPGQAYRPTATLLYHYDAHASWVLDAARQPGGTRIASAGADGNVRIWDAETGAALLTYRGHTRLLKAINIQARVSVIAWSPDGKLMASAGAGSSVHIWDAASGQTVTRYQAHSGLLPDVWALVWSPDGQLMASACCSIGRDKTIHIWDARTGQTRTRSDASASWMPPFSVLSLAWSPDGTWLAAACGDKTIRIWERATGHPPSCLAPPGPAIWPGRPIAASWLLRMQTRPSSSGSATDSRRWSTMGIQTGSDMWPGHPMEDTWPARPTTGRCASGRR